MTFLATPFCTKSLENAIMTQHGAHWSIAMKKTTENSGPVLTFLKNFNQPLGCQKFFLKA